MFVSDDGHVAEIHAEPGYAEVVVDGGCVARLNKFSSYVRAPCRGAAFSFATRFEGAFYVHVGDARFGPFEAPGSCWSNPPEGTPPCYRIGRRSLLCDGYVYDLPSGEEHTVATRCAPWFGTRCKNHLLAHDYEYGRFHQLSDPAFDHAGLHFAFIGKRRGAHVLYVDGEDVAALSGMGICSLDPTGRHTACVVPRGEKRPTSTSMASASRRSAPLATGSRHCRTGRSASPTTKAEGAG